MVNKTCSKCRQAKPLDEYNKGKGRFGKIAVCKSCSKERNKASIDRRRANLMSLPRYLTEEQEVSIFEHFNNSCALTGLKDKLCLDHFVPLDWGVTPLKYGLGGTTFPNMIPFHISINSAKNAMNPVMLFERYGEKYNISADRWNAALKYLAEKNGLSVADYTNRVNACYMEVQSDRWATGINKKVETNGEIVGWEIERALRRNLNIQVVIELFGTSKTKDYFRTTKVSEMIARRKFEMEVRQSKVKRNLVEITKEVERLLVEYRKRNQ
ncbi:hypothetical protein [Cohnella yongneupensis]|uniref:HNH endonuclease n=1 Tax=Cohnella yongneupensis TaxID=425006 RepID=A0ABW0R1I6_9BACL